MMRFVNIMLGLSLSASAFAAQTRNVREETVLRDITVAPTNGGINPDARAYIVKGDVQLGSNSCYAQGLQAQLKVENQADGTRQIVAYVQGRQPRNLICIEIYKPVFAEVSVTVRGSNNLAETVFIRNAEESGSLQPLTNYTENGASQDECGKPVFCTREYRPTTCSLNGAEFSGSNRCDALAQAKQYACLNGIEFLAEDVDCQTPAPAAN